MDLIIYHCNCYDGFTAAWVAWKRFPDADFHPAKYGEPPPDVANRNVLVVDFSYPRDVLLEIYTESASLRVLDHHKTAAADLEGLDFCEFDMERSGCRMAWDYLFPGDGHPPPRLLDLIEDRDLWRFRFGEETKRAHAYVASLPMTFEAWDDAMRIDPQLVFSGGGTVRRYIDRYCEKAIEESYVRTWGLRNVALVNVPYQNASEMAGLLLDKHEGAEYCAGWFMRSDGRVQFSLRSRGDFDVSEVAKEFGGGGHAGAAGFDVSLDEALGLIAK